MFCPQCGSTQSDELKFCKQCGANLSAVRQAVASRETDGKFDWGKTWVAEMFLSGEEAVRRQKEIERLQGLTPEVKRIREVKAGVITGCVGLALTLLLLVLMQGIILGGGVSPGAAEILSRLWVVGMIPLFVGLALVVNGLFVSKKLVELAGRDAQPGPDAVKGDAAAGALRAADTTEFIPTGFSVTEGTTKHLSNPARKK